MSGKNMMRYARMLLCIILLAALLSGRTGAAKADGPAGAASRSNEGGDASPTGQPLPYPVILKEPEAASGMAAFTLYNEEIELVTAGEAEGGIFVYALGTDADTEPDSSRFSPDIPTPQENTFPVGVYHVWYKVIGDDSHQNTVPEVVTVIIPPLIACKNNKTDELDLNEFAAACLGTQEYDNTMFFYLPKDIAKDDTMLTVNGGQSGQPTDLRGITFGVAALSGLCLQKGDTVNLIYNKNGLIMDDELSTVDSSHLAKADFLAPRNRAVDMKYELSISKKDNTTIICTVENVENPDPDPIPDPIPVPDPDPIPDPLPVPASAPPFDKEHVDFFIPAGSIGANAFAGDEAIAIVDASQCTSLGEHAFRDCKGLTQILLPADCVFLSSAFEGCEALVAIYAPGAGTTQEWAEAAGIPFMPVE